MFAFEKSFLLLDNLFKGNESSPTAATARLGWLRSVGV